MTSSYDDIFSRFYSKVQDYKLSGFDENLANEVLTGYLRNGASDVFVRKLFSSCVFDDDSGEVEWELVQPYDEYGDVDFVEDIFCEAMVIQWVYPQYHSTLLTSQFFTNKEQSFYSQANHMAELKAMYELAKTNLRKKIRDRGYQYALTE